MNLLGSLDHRVALAIVAALMTVGGTTIAIVAIRELIEKHRRTGSYTGPGDMPALGLAT